MEHLVLECLLAAPEPIDSVLACANACGIPIADARSALEALTRDELIVWVPSRRRWDATPAGLDALEGGISRPDSRTRNRGRGGE